MSKTTRTGWASGNELLAWESGRGDGIELCSDDELGLCIRDARRPHGTPLCSGCCLVRITVEEIEDDPAAAEQAKGT